jgi:hypothetical protein
MGIGVIGPIEPDAFSANLVEAVRDAGHVAVQLGPARASHRLRAVGGLAELSLQALPRLDLRAQRRIVRAAAKASCDLVISVDGR